MRQRRSLELIKDYECEINYHPGKANVVANVLSRNSMVELGALGISQPRLIKEFARIELEVVDEGDGSIRIACKDQSCSVGGL
jgi:hypothetical protein